MTASKLEVSHNSTALRETHPLAHQLMYRAKLQVSVLRSAQKRISTDMTQSFVTCVVGTISGPSPPYEASGQQLIEIPRPTSAAQPTEGFTESES